METEISLTSEDFEDFTIPRQRKRWHWRKIIYEVIAIQGTELWKKFFLFIIITNYFHASYISFFQRKLPYGYHLYFLIACDGFYGIDFIFALIVKLWKKIQVKLRYTPRRKSTIILGFILALPYPYVYQAFTSSKTLSISSICLRSIYFFRIFHLLIYFYEKFNDAGSKHWMYFLVNYFITTVILHHTTAIVWYILACPLNQSRTKGWAIHLKEIPKTPWEWYITCIYFAMSVATNCGFGDIVPVTSSEIIVTIMVMAIGFTLTTGIFIGTLSAYFVNAFKRRATLRDQIRDIELHLKTIGMNKGKAQSIMKYYETLWYKKSGVKKTKDLDLLPYSLEAEIYFDINLRLLMRSVIFKLQPEAFLRRVSYLMKHEFYQHGDIIFHQNVLKYKMICIVSGTVEVLSEEDNESCLISFGPGSIIGEATLVLNIPSKASLRAGSYLELQVLYKKDFLKLVDLYPNIYANISQMIQERINKAKSSFKEHISKTEINLFVPQISQLPPIKAVKELLKSKERPQFLSLYQLVDPGSKIEENLCLTTKFPWIFQPSTSLLLTWEVFIIIIALFVGIAYPYYVTFHREFPPWLESLSIFIDIIYHIDLFIILTTGIEVKNRTIQTFTEILHVKLREFGFYLDIFSCFHIEVFAYLTNEANHLYYVLKLNRVLKIYRICKIFATIENNLKLNVLLIRLTKYPIFLLFCSSIFGSILYFTSCYNELCVESGWFFQKLMQNTRDNISNPSIQYKYSISAYFALSCLSSIGYGDILATNMLDMILVYFGVIAGILLFGYCTAELSATITHNFKEKTSFRESLYAIRKFMDDKKIRAPIKQRVLNFFELQWYYNKGKTLSEESLFSSANKKIQDDVLMKERQDTITKVPLFSNTNLDFVQLIVIGAKCEILPPNETIIYSGGTNREFYIIEKGYCHEYLVGEEVILGPNSHFGMESLLAGLPPVNTVRTITHVKLICISNKLFWTTVSMFPAVEKEFQTVLTQFNIKDKLASLSVGKMEILDMEDSYKYNKPSFVYVPKFCKKRNENYSHSFVSLSCTNWFRFLIIPVSIHPSGQFLKTWIVFRFIIAIVNVISTSIQEILAPYSLEFDYLLLALDGVAYLDLFLMMFVGYYGPENQLIVHPLKTAMHYIKGMFVIDLLLCFPYEILIKYLLPLREVEKTDYSHISPPDYFHGIARFVRVLQVYRLPAIFHYLSNDIKRKTKNIQIIKYVSFTSIIILIWATFFTKITCQNYHKYVIEKSKLITKDGFGQPPGMVIDNNYIMFCEKYSWIDRSKYRNMTDAIHVYILSIYFSTSTLINCGFGDVTAENLTQIILSMLMMICGFLFFGYVYASISSHKASLENKLMLHRKMVKELKKYMMEQNVTKNLQRNIIEYLEFNWKRNKGAKPKKILSNLPAALYEDTVLNMYEKTLKELPLFEGVDRSFFRIIGKELTEGYFRRKQIILRTQDIIDSIFIIYRGKVEVISHYKGIQAFVGIGGIFGNITTNAKTKISVTITALSNVDVLHLNTERFYDITKNYPTIVRKMKTLFQEGLDFIIPTVLIDDDETDEAKYPTKNSAAASMFSNYNKNLNITSKKIMFNRYNPGFLLIILPHRWFKSTLWPESLLFTCMNFSSLIIAYVNCILVMYEFAFQNHTFTTLILCVSFDVFFFIKIFLEMHKAFENRYGEYVLNNKKILNKYLTDWKKRILEILANLPIYYFVFLMPFTTEANFNLYFSSLRLITLLRIMYIYEFYKDKADKLMVNRLYLKIIILVICLTLICHFLACIWYLFACPLTFCLKRSWITDLHRRKLATNNKYLVCLYFIINVMTTTGMGDILPETYIEQIYVTSVMIATKFLTGIYIGDIMCALNSCIASRTNYEYEIIELRDYLHSINVSSYQIKKMWKYVRQLWTKSNGKQIPYLLPLLPYSLKCDLTTEIYGEHLRNSYLFSEVEDAFIRQLCGYFKHMNFFPKNYIVQHGDSDKSMYFIHSGEVDILTVHSNLTETVHEVLRTGEMFGLVQGLFRGIPHHFSFRAKTNVEIISLTLTDWEDLMSFFPNSKAVIYKKATEIYSMKFNLSNK